MLNTKYIIRGIMCYRKKCCTLETNFQISVYNKVRLVLKTKAQQQPESTTLWGWVEPSGGRRICKAGGMN